MIAISYRREDSLPITGRLYDRLQAKFGKEKVFMDFDSIPPGVDFRQKITEMIEGANLMIAVIGPKWFGTQNDGSRRIDEPLDIVRLELEHALNRGIPIIPLLVNNTSMPKPDELPSSLQSLVFRNALPLDSGIDFHNHTDRLISGIRELVGRGRFRHPEAIRATLRPRTSSRVFWMIFAAGLGVIAILAAIAGNWLSRQPAQKPALSTAAPTPQAPSSVAIAPERQPTAPQVVEPQANQPQTIEPQATEPSVASSPSTREKIETSPIPAVPAGSVRIITAPGGATVVDENGRELGETPLPLPEVTPGEVSYEIRKVGYKTIQTKANVQPGQESKIELTLEKAVAAQSGPPWTNSLGMKFVQLGTIRMSVWETRVQDYDAFSNATGHEHTAADFEQTATHPVVKVSWYDAIAFCKWLTDKERNENVLDQGQTYRLPTDLEWSMAAGLTGERGGTPEARDHPKTEFPWGKRWPPPNGAGNYADRAAKGHVRGKLLENYADGFSYTSPVGTFKPNPFGIYDLGGNVWEWCLDAYKGDNNPAAADWGVLRGGSWATSQPWEMQSSYRNEVDRHDADVTYGFRCVLATQETSDSVKTDNPAESR